MASEPTIRASAALRALHAARLDEADARSALEAAGLDPSLLEDPEGDAPLRGYVALLEELAARLGDPHFGLRAGLATSPSELGVVGYVLMASADVTSALGKLVRYFAVHQEGADLALEGDDDHARVRYQLVDPTLAPREQDAELAIGVAVATLRFLFGPGFAPAAVWFEHAAPPDLAEMRALIGITPSYSRPYNAIAIDRALLDHPVPNHDPALLSILERHALELLAQRSDPSSLGARVRGALADRLRDGSPSMDEVARSLGTSASTMRRRLSEEGTTFADELDAVRRALAERYLLDPQLSLSAIAFLLGFSEASAFTRAFRRWHRTTPKAYRRAHLG